MDARTSGPWPYASSPGASWSSEEGVPENSSKRSSAALSGCSDDPDSPSVGTDFTRDFYRLVKFESTKSLASTSSRGGKPPDREQALQNVLSFIAEQQMYLAELPHHSHDAATETPQSEGEGFFSHLQIYLSLIPFLILYNLQFLAIAACLASHQQIERIHETITAEQNSIRENGQDISDIEPVEDILEQITVPPLAPDERIVTAVACNGGISYTTVAPSELGAVPEEDEEAATSSTPSTVVSNLFSKKFIQKFRNSNDINTHRDSFLISSIGKSGTGAASCRR